MNKLTITALGFVTVILLMGGLGSARNTEVQEGRKPQDVYTLATNAKLGPVKFNHLDHITKNRAIDGKQIACVDCHHTAQPAAEALKHPPHKMAWPADRTVTLTAESLADASTPPVTVCTDCHARAEAKPKVLPEIPKLEETVLNNQQAFHRNCGSCHDAIAKTKETTAPTSKKCVGCHKKTAA